MLGRDRGTQDEEKALGLLPQPGLQEEGRPDIRSVQLGLEGSFSGKRIRQFSVWAPGKAVRGRDYGLSQAAPGQSRCVCLGRGPLPGTCTVWSELGKQTRNGEMLRKGREMVQENMSSVQLVVSTNTQDQRNPRDWVLPSAETRWLLPKGSTFL